MKKSVWPLLKQHRLWVKSQKKSGQKYKKTSQSKKRKSKKTSSLTLGRNLEKNLNEDDVDIEQSTEVAHDMDFQDDFPLQEQLDQQNTAARGSDETEQVNVEEAEIEVRSGETEEVDLEGTDVEIVQSTALQGTARQFLITPRTLDFQEDVGPSNPAQQEEHLVSDDETIADIMLNLSRQRGITIPGVEQSQVAQASSQPTIDPKDKGKGILVETKKKKKLKLADLKAIEEAKNEEAARRMQAEWNAQEAKKTVVQTQRPIFWVKGHPTW